MNIEKQIKYWQKKFRILESWKIEFDPDPDYKDQANFSERKRLAIIYGSSYKRVPTDYVLHEMIHIALTEVRKTAINGNSVYAREKEENFVQDICTIVREKDEQIRKLRKKKSGSK